MLTLEEFYKNYQNEITESEAFEIKYGDSGVTKAIKRFLNWFLGSSDKDMWDPYNRNYNSDAAEEVLDELRKDGEKFNIEIKEIATFEEFKIGVDRAVEFLNIKQAFHDKVVVKKWKDHKFACIQMTVGEVCKNQSVILFAYKYKKDRVSIDIIEGIYSFAKSIYIKDFLSKLKSFLKKQMKKDKLDLKHYSIRIVRLSEKAGWSFDKLLEYMANNKSQFERLENEEVDKSVERIFISKL